MKNESLDMEQEKVNIDNRNERLDYISRLHEDIREAKRECEAAKYDYSQVTSYLKDIQLIDRADEEQQDVLREIGEGIHELMKDRESLKGTEYKVTDAQRSAIEINKETIEQDMENLQETEEYQVRIKNDLRQLTSEKNMLKQERREIISKQRILKILARCMAIIMVSLGSLILAVNIFFEVDVVLLFCAFILFCLLSLAFILLESNRNRRSMKVTEQQINRAITLLNKVKIKYVNNTNLLDYVCAKYRVRSGADLEFVYGQYVQAEAELTRKQEGTRLLGEYSKVLVHELDKLGVLDKDIWLYQAEALYNPKEMVEIRHNLNGRRQKLRERLDYNAKVMENRLAELEQVQSMNPEYRQDVEDVLQSKK